MLQLGVKKILPYIIIALAFGALLLFKHPQIFRYKFNQNLVGDYLRSQDIEDPKDLIHDRIFVSDNVIYQAAGYLYAKGANPTSYNFQHPPLVKYLFGASILLTGNPFYIQILFGLGLLWLTFWLSQKVKLGWLGYLGVLGLLIDPVFGGMMNETLLDLGQTVFALAYVILTLFCPESYILQGITLGLFAASKFWSTAIIFVILIWGFRVFRDFGEVRKKIKPFFLSLLIALAVFSLTYTKFFLDGGTVLGYLGVLGKVLKFMLTHNSAGAFGGEIALFFTGYIKPWTILWPVGLIVGVFRAVREFWGKTKNAKLFIYFFPLIYLLLISTQIPFTRYFIIILPFIYINIAAFFGFLVKIIYDRTRR